MTLLKKIFLPFIFFFTAASFFAWADDLRPASLHIAEQAEEGIYNVVFKLPATADGKRLSLHLVFDDSVKDYTPKSIIFTGDTFIESWKIKHDDQLKNASMTIEGLVKTYNDVLFRFSDKNQKTSTYVISADAPIFTFDENFSVESFSLFQLFVTYIILGVEHILFGFDHLLFVLCLVYIAQTPRRIIQTITGFTLAHSITLILASLNVVRLPIAPMEAVIALSIVFLSVELNKNNKKTFTYKYPVAISSLFGLLHGFGFASVLADIGLPDTEKIAALLFFNIGVEIGQILFLAFLLILYFLLSKILKIPTDILRKIVSYICGIIASLWVIERLLGFL